MKDTFGIHEGDSDVHLRLTMLNEVDEVALANGEPPQMSADSPEHLRYLIAARSGEDLKSTFTSVIEPYQNERFIRSIERVEVKDGDAVISDDTVQAVKVVLENGRTDYIVYALDADVLYTIDERLQFKGFFGVYSEKDGEMVQAYVHDGTMIGLVDEELVIEEATGHLQGTIKDFTKEMSLENEIVVGMDPQGVNVDQLIGKYIQVDHDQIRNGFYEIKGVTEVGEDQYALDIGDTTLIRSYVDANDFSQGYLYNVAEHAPFRISLSYTKTPPPTLAELQQQLDDLVDEDAFANDAVIRALRLHLTAVRQFENQGASDKVVKHMNSFKVLLDHQKSNVLMTEQAYEILKVGAQAIIEFHNAFVE